MSAPSNTLPKFLARIRSFSRRSSANDDNLTYGSIISVYNGEDESITALTDDGMEELEQMLSYARRSTQEWNDFVDSFVDEELIARIKAKPPR